MHIRGSLHMLTYPLLSLCDCGADNVPTNVSCKLSEIEQSYPDLEEHS